MRTLGSAGGADEYVGVEDVASLRRLVCCVTSMVGL